VAHVTVLLSIYRPINSACQPKIVQDVDELHLF
jgi:hypothetical protein